MRSLQLTGRIRVTEMPVKTGKGFSKRTLYTVGSYVFWLQSDNTPWVPRVEEHSTPAYKHGRKTNPRNQWRIDIMCDGEGINIHNHFLVSRIIAFANPDICGGFDIFRTEVHHINGINHDNRPQNLICLSPQEHRLVHRGLININQLKSLIV